MTFSNVSADDAIPLRYLQEIPISPKPASRSVVDLKRTLDDLSDENATLHDQLFAERHSSLAIKCDLERERERALELEQLLRQALEDKAQCVGELQRLDADSKAWLGQRALLKKACEDLQAKTSEMEATWRAKEARWTEAAVSYEQKIHDLVERLTEANRQLRLRCGSDYHKRSLEDAQEQIRLLKRRLRSEQLDKIRESVTGSEATLAQESIEVLGLKRDNTRLSAKVRALEDQLAEKNSELNAFRAQLGEVQSLLRDNLDRQNQAVHESKTFGVAIGELRDKVEAQLEQIAEYQAVIRRLESNLEAERTCTAELRSQLQRTEADRDRFSAQVAGLQKTQDDLQTQLESMQPMKKAIVEIAAERDDVLARLRKVQNANADLHRKADALQSENGRVRCELQNLIDTVSSHERKLAAQATWYSTWKNDIDSVSKDLSMEADRLKQLRRLENDEIQRLKLRLVEAEDALKEAQAKNARMDSVLDRVISTC